MQTVSLDLDKTEGLVVQKGNTTSFPIPFKELLRRRQHPKYAERNGSPKYSEARSTYQYRVSFQGQRRAEKGERPSRILEITDVGGSWVAAWLLEVWCW